MHNRGPDFNFKNDRTGGQEMGDMSGRDYEELEEIK